MRHIVQAQQFDRALMYQLFRRADELRQLLADRRNKAAL